MVRQQGGCEGGIDCLRLLQGIHHRGVEIAHRHVPITRERLRYCTQLLQTTVVAGNLRSTSHLVVGRWFDDHNGGGWQRDAKLVEKTAVAGAIGVNVFGVVDAVEAVVHAEHDGYERWSERQHIAANTLCSRTARTAGNCVSTDSGIVKLDMEAESGDDDVLEKPGVEPLGCNAVTVVDDPVAGAEMNFRSWCPGSKIDARQQKKKLRERYFETVHVVNRKGGFKMLSTAFWGQQKVGPEFDIVDMQGKNLFHCGCLKRFIFQGRTIMSSLPYQPQTYLAQLGLMLGSMICWGSWASTLKLTPGWPFALFYWDYVVGVLGGSIVFGLFLGGGTGFVSLLGASDLAHILLALAAGVIFNLANELLWRRL